MSGSEKIPSNNGYYLKERQDLAKRGPQASKCGVFEVDEEVKGNRRVEVSRLAANGVRSQRSASTGGASVCLKTLEKRDRCWRC